MGRTRMVNRTFAAILTVVTVLILGFGGKARADFMALNGSEVAPNIAEFRIQEDGVRVRFEVFYEDIGRTEC